MREECKLSCVKIIVWSMVVQEGTNIIIIYIFEYGAEYGGEGSAESGAEYYFIFKTYRKYHFKKFFQLHRAFVYLSLDF